MVRGGAHGGRSTKSRLQGEGRGTQSHLQGDGKGTQSQAYTVSVRPSSINYACTDHVTVDKNWLQQLTGSCVTIV